jgi:hypothetical protein
VESITPNLSQQEKSPPSASILAVQDFVGRGQLLLALDLVAQYVLAIMTRSKQERINYSHCETHFIKRGVTCSLGPIHSIFKPRGFESSILLV